MNHLQPPPLIDPFPNPFEPPEHMRELPPQTPMATSKLILRFDPSSNLHHSISCPLLVAKRMEDLTFKKANHRWERNIRDQIEAKRKFWGKKCEFKGTKLKAK
ncbi:hypothetical protein EPI10_003957 [Gossypium australe]|uniref:Uncharacterized protein n=1 Tax=Gossypium australe TaxID=47621 RepID=A0A5B6UHI6_9ROSI|nr:hypothetical protein EPI10_003957 [Gossypium australe]